MSFEVPADAYDQFMGRFSGPLAGPFAAWLRLGPGQRVLDVGCGPGALTEVLVARLGAGFVSAVDSSESFAAAVRERLPGVDVRSGVAEALPWADGVFDCAAAQLVVHLMADPLAGLAEMARVTRPGAADGDLAGLLRQAGLGEVESTVLTVSLRLSSFEDWWKPFTLGVGPPGSYLAGLDDERRAAVRDARAGLFPSGPFTMSVRSWAARGRA